MSVKSVVISSFATFLLGSDIFQKIKNVVSEQEQKLIEGPKKSDAVLAELQVIGIGVAANLLNLGIELAVAWLKTQTSK